MTVEPDIKPDTEEAKAHFANYTEYNKTLRTWFVTFGIAGLALLLTNNTVFQELPSQDRRCLVYGFTLGVFSQVFVAFLNKCGAWYMYVGAAYPHLKKRRSVRFWEFLTAQYWIDIVADALSGICFILVVYLLAHAKL
jgi:hypothetical protein